MDADGTEYNASGDSTSGYHSSGYSTSAGYPSSGSSSADHHLSTVYPSARARQQFKSCNPAIV
jgi:hypothetical protein